MTEPTDRAVNELTPVQEAAAMHGLATNKALPIADRLQCALQALAWYEAEVERTRPVVEAAVALRAVHSLPVDTQEAAREVEYLIDEATSALAEAVDSYTQSSNPGETS